MIYIVYDMMLNYAIKHAITGVFLSLVSGSH